MKKLLFSICVLLSSIAQADGVDDERFYKPNPHDVNYWSGFDKHPCSYDLGYNERECDEYLGHKKHVNPGYVEHGNGNHHNIKPIPEPESLLMIGVGIAALAAYKKAISTK